MILKSLSRIRLILMVGFALLSYSGICQTAPNVTISGSEYPHPDLKYIYFAQTENIDIQCLNYTWYFQGALNTEYVPNEPRAVWVKWDSTAATHMVRVNVVSPGADIPDELANSCVGFAGQAEINPYLKNDRLGCIPDVALKFNCMYGYAYITLNLNSYSWTPSDTAETKIIKDGETVSFVYLGGNCNDSFHSITASYSDLRRGCTDCNVTIDTECTQPTN